MKSITKRAIVEFVVAELKIFPQNKEFPKACENYVKLELRMAEKGALNSKLANFCKHVKTLYIKFSKYYE